MKGNMRDDIDDYIEYWNGEIIELVEATDFYPKGKKAEFIREVQENPKKVEIRFLDEIYIGEDVDVFPKDLFRKVEG